MNRPVLALPSEQCTTIGPISSSGKSDLVNLLEGLENGDGDLTQDGYSNPETVIKLFNFMFNYLTCLINETRSEMLGSVSEVPPPQLVNW